MNSLAASAAERLAHYTELAVQFREWAKSEADAEARAGLLDMAFQYERLTNEVKARIDAILRSGASRPVGLPQLVWAVREPRAELFGLLMVGELHIDHRVIGSIVGVAEHGEIEPVMIEPLAHRAEQVGETSRANPDVDRIHRTPALCHLAGACRVSQSPVARGRSR